MPQNFLACDRDQELLLPPNLRDWLPEDHFAWFVLDAVDEMNLDAFYASYRADGHGRAAHDPRMMVALLLYAYARGERSSREIERALSEDVAYRVIAANATPDHATIARFRQRHEAAIAELFGEVLGLCAKAGIAQPTVLCVDSTKLHANASRDATRTYEQLAKEILEEADAVDQAEDEQFGDRRGDELPDKLTTRDGRRAWLREAKRQLDEERAKEAKPVPKSRPARVKEAKRRLEEELFTEQRANESYEAWRAQGRMRDGRRIGRGHSEPKPYSPPAIPTGKVNVSDPDSTLVKSRSGFIQGYSAQAAVNEHQVVVAAELHSTGTDFGQLGPVVDKALDELRNAGIEDPPDVILADAGYWHTQQIETLNADGTIVLIPPDSSNRKGKRPGWDKGLYAFMRRVLDTDAGHELYVKRKATIEPVFAQMKFNRRMGRFQRRGRSACRSEWRLIAATHNLLKLHRHEIALAAA
jgi:transposase